ncbi:MAG TPA: TIGR01777 family oxidoreductase [Anaerolineales bacterium]|nr:TIGR01777 family oxidoreductase [Anaerolineales bacterium]
MRVLIAGGSGFLGTVLMRLLIARGHSVKILTRSSPRTSDGLQWDGAATGAWARQLEETDIVVNACGHSLHHWPWTSSRKRQFLESRVVPGQALVAAFAGARNVPRAFIQFSGINRYGLNGDESAVEETPPGSDFLAQLTIQWEDSTRPVEELGVRRVIVRNGIVLDSRRGLYPLMCLPARLYCGGRLGSGSQVVPWIHIEDHVRALLFLIEGEESTGAYNLVAPENSTNDEFMRMTCAELRRPYWLNVPGSLLRLALGEMADLVLYGRPSQPERILQAGFHFAFPNIRSAAHDLLCTAPHVASAPA